MARPPSPERSPTVGLLLGLVVTLAAVLAYSAYITWQVEGLRKLQAELIDRNRKDSLQLLRIQNDLNLLAVAMTLIVRAGTTFPYFVRDDRCVLIFLSYAVNSPHPRVIPSRAT